MDRESVFLRVDGDRAQAEFGRGAEDTDRDFTAVGNQQFSLTDRGGVRTHKSGANESQNQEAKQQENEAEKLFF